MSWTLFPSNTELIFRLFENRRGMSKFGDPPHISHITGFPEDPDFRKFQMERKMSKFEVKNVFKELYQPSKREFSVVEVPEMNFLMIDGHGDPNLSPAYQESVEALYTTAYSIKFRLKPQGFEYSVPPLEGLWWMEDMSRFSLNVKDEWNWTMMIMQPAFITETDMEAARSEVLLKKGLASLHRLRFASYHEGLSAQILYLGAYSNEGPTIARMHEFIHANGYHPRGKHHEIYLGDPRRTTPEKLKTVIRQPIQRLNT
jgi:hypothetical protein